jgi:hypothetical protein
MSAFDTIKAAIIELPISDILKARLELAFDRAAELESKVETLQKENANLHAQLEIERLNHKNTRDELQRLKDEHAEETRIHNSIEFRRGKRTGGVWMAFCPSCHLPCDMSKGLLLCSDQKCGWKILFAATKLPEIVAEL